MDFSEDFRIDVCPLGIETDLFTYKRRRRKPGKPFRWLAVCAPNPRKWTVLEEAFGYLRGYYGDGVELYVKTTAADLRRVPSWQWHQWGVGPHQSATIRHHPNLPSLQA